MQTSTHTHPIPAAGLDSLGAVELRNSLEGSFQVQLPGTLVFDYPSTASLVSYLQTLVRIKSLRCDCNICNDDVM
jgi:acyl carrier protein